MSYTIQHLSKELIFISWKGTPSTNVAKQFIKELHEIVNISDKAIYFMSDLRKGRIIDIRVISELGRLTQHKNWGGSVAFTNNIISKTFVKTFRKLSFNQQESNAMFDEFEDARAFLEHLKPDVTDGIDWLTVLENGSSAQSSK